MCTDVQDQAAVLIWHSEFHKQIEAFVCSYREPGQQGYVLLYNISLETLASHDWQYFKRVWLDNYASDDYHDRIKRAFVLLPVDKDTKELCKWTHMAGLSQMCTEYREREDRHDDWRLLSRLVKKTLVATIPLDSEVHPPYQYAFGIYAVVPESVGSDLDSCIGSKEGYGGLIRALAKGTRLVLGAGIGHPYSDVLGSGALSYRRLIAITPESCQKEDYHCTVFRHVELFVNLWKCRNGKPPRLSGASRDAQQASESYLQKKHVGSGEVRETQSLLQTFCYMHFNGCGNSDDLQQRRENADTFWGLMSSRFDPPDQEVIRNALVKLEYLTADAALPQPYWMKTGVRGKSRVYSFFVKTGRTSTACLVAKFDDPARAEREWSRVPLVRKIVPHQNILLPINDPEDRVIICHAALGADHRICSDLDDYLRRQLAHVPANCATVLDVAFGVLGSLHSADPVTDGTMSDDQGQPSALVWRYAYPQLSSQSDELRQTAQTAWDGIDWTADTFSVPECEGRPFANPFVGLESRLDAQTGRVRVSWVHGDLNLSNILLSEDSSHAPADAFVIDLANCEDQKIIATDFARLESEFWQETYPEVSYNHRRWQGLELVKSFVAVRDVLDGRDGKLAAPRSRLRLGCLRFVGRLRSLATTALGADMPGYFLEDYFHCLHFSSLAALAFPSVRRDSLKTLIALLGSALALETLEDLHNGLYSTGQRHSTRRTYNKML